MIEDRVRFGTSGKRKMTAAQLVQAMEEPASQDIRTKPLVLKPILHVMGRPKDKASQNALALLKQWAARGGHRRDLNRDGHYDDDAAVTLMDAWWPKLVAAEFRPVMGNAVFDSLAGIQPISNPIGGAATAPDFFDGWWGYVSKDLRGVAAAAAQVARGPAQGQARAGAPPRPAQGPLLARLLRPRARSSAAARSCGPACARRWG